MAIRNRSSGVRLTQTLLRARHDSAHHEREGDIVRNKLFVLLAVLAMAFAIIPIASAADGPALDPDAVEAAVFPGDSIELTKTVHTPELPPVLDVCMVVDLSGSYNDDLPNIKAVAPGIWDDIVTAGVTDLQMGLATFVDFPFPIWGSAVDGDYAYRLDQQLTDDKTTWTDAIDLMTTKNGGDGPESQYEAFYQLTTGAGNPVEAPGTIAPGQQCNFRADATKVAIMTTDASFHNAGDAGGPFPYPGHSAVDTTNALVAADIVVIGLKAPGAGVELDALAAATGGSTVETTATSSDIADAILEALEAIKVEVSMTSNCAWPISTSFDPDIIPDVTGGEHVVFTETISVAVDAPGGTYTCEDWALIDGQPMTDDAGAIIYETKTIEVPVAFLTGGGQIGDNKVAISFGGNVGYLADGSIVGQWQFQDHDKGNRLIMHSLDITLVHLANDLDGDPDPPTAPANIVEFEGAARVKVGNDKWIDTCTFNAEAHDHGEPSVDDQFAIFIDCGADGSWDYFPVVDLDQGNLQIHEGPKG
jgi:hypothetical protein